MEIVYRTLVLKYDLLRLPPEVAEKIPALLKVQEEFRRWATWWALSGGSLPPPEHNPLRYFAKKFLHTGKMLDWLKGLEKNGIEVRGARPPLIFDAQLRLGGERDMSRGVLVDLPKRELRIRKWGGARGNTITLPLSESAVKWILERVREGGRLVLAAVWVGRSRRSHAAKLYVALVFRRDVVPMEAKRLLVVDFNALHNGLAWAVVEEERILGRGILRPNISRILHLQKVAARLESICAKEDRSCEEAMATQSRIWRLLRSWEDEAVKKIVRLALQYKATVIVDVPDHNSIKALKEGNYASERKAFLNFGRIRRRLQGLAEWYGVPYREERLYSTICPRCGGKMEELPNRRVRCQCGFEAHRDEVPFYWAQKRFHELITPSFSSPSAVLHITALNRGGRLGQRRDADGANSSTKQRAGFVFMEIPKWIKIRELTGVVEDPVNFVAMLTLDEVVEVLVKEGWEFAVHGFSAYLDEKKPSYVLQKPLPGVGALMRLHTRLWSDGVVVGNAHLDVPTVDAFMRLSPHDSIHDLGKAYVAYLFIKHGYQVELIYLGNVTKTNDGFAIKIFKADAEKRP